MLMEMARMGHPVLARRAKPVEDIYAIETQFVIQSLIETHRAQGDMGLSAPQLYIPLRIMLMEVTKAQQNSRGLQAEFPLTIFINPEMEIIDSHCVSEPEGCFSVPGLYGYVPRFTAIRYRALDKEGRTIEGELHGFLARVFQHEFDHLNGILYPLRIVDRRQMGFLDDGR